MIIISIIYIILMAVLFYRRFEVKNMTMLFGSSNVAKAAGMIAIEEMMKLITIIYILSMLLVWIFKGV